MFKMALDFMLDEAMSVPCEAIFSLAASTNLNMPHHACISNDMMESLQVLKYLIY